MCSVFCCIFSDKNQLDSKSILSCLGLGWCRLGCNTTKLNLVQRKNPFISSVLKSEVPNQAAGSSCASSLPPWTRPSSLKFSGSPPLFLSNCRLATAARSPSTKWHVNCHVHCKLRRHQESRRSTSSLLCPIFPLKSCSLCAFAFPPATSRGTLTCLASQMLMNQLPLKHFLE